MRILADKNLLNTESKGQYVFVDNDFLGQLFEHGEVSRELKELMPNAVFMLDPYIEIEFRRDVFLPNKKLLIEDFVNSPLLNPVIDHQSIYRKVQINGLLLSQIYAHQKHTGISFVDLMLAARVMLAAYPALIITGNRRHFPNCIFDNRAILSLEQVDGTVQSFYLIKFNKGKFEECNKLINQVK